MAFILKVRRVDIDTGGDNQVVLIRGRDAEAFGILPSDRLEISYGRRKMIVVADITHHSIKHGEIGLFADAWLNLKPRDGAPIKINAVTRPTSISAINKKLLGHQATAKEIRSIIEDIVNHKLGSVETTYYAAAGYVKPFTNRELVATVKAMAETGSMFNWGNRKVVDKHSVGGLAGNRTTMVAIPIIASLGLLIPKTSSRAITSPAGTADTMEVLAPVSFNQDQVYRIVEQAGGCLIWGGGLSIAPADDLIIRVSRPLSLESYDKMIVSILAKKVAMGIKYLIIDLPYGHGTKVPNIKKAQAIAKRFVTVAKPFHIKVRVKYDPAEEPIGQGVGPALEARDVVRVLQQKENRPVDLENKAVGLAGELLEMSGYCRVGQGRKIAARQVTSGRAWKKMKQIIDLQGGQSNIDSEEITRGAFIYDYRAIRSGNITKIDNRAINDVARTLGAPDHKLAGIFIHAKLGTTVTKGQAVISLYSHSADRIKMAKKELSLARLLTIK